MNTISINFIAEGCIFELAKIITKKYDQIVADLKTEINKLVEDIREKEVAAVEEAKRLRTVTNDYIGQKPFDLDPDSLAFDLTVEQANITIKLSASPQFNIDQGFPADFPEDIEIPVKFHLDELNNFLVWHK